MQRVASSTCGSTSARGRAGVEAAGAAAAVVGRERRIRRQREIGEDGADEEERAGAGPDQHGVLADPAEAGALGQLALGDRAVVHVGMRDRGPALEQEPAQSSSRRRVTR